MTADQPPYEQMADEAEMPTEGAEGVVGVADEVEAELPSSVHDMAAYEAEAVQDHQDFQDPVGDSHVAKDGAGKASMGALSKVPPPGHSFTGAGAIPGMLSCWNNGSAVASFESCIRLRSFINLQADSCHD